MDDAKAALEKAYEGERFVTVLPGAAVPHTRHVRGRCAYEKADKYANLYVGCFHRSLMYPPSNEAQHSILCPCVHVFFLGGGRGEFSPSVSMIKSAGIIYPKNTIFLYGSTSLLENNRIFKGMFGT